MHFNIWMNINNDPIQKQFLREYSYWYKYLNRKDEYYKAFINDMKHKYKLTPGDKINKMVDNINTFRAFLEVLK